MLSIIIPARNESDNLEDILNYFKNGMGTINYEIILINDFSEDNTFEQAKEIFQTHKNFKIYNNEKKGLGGAINLGIDKSNGSKICIMMADLSDDINDLKKYNNLLEEKNLDAVLGSRFLKDSKVVEYPKKKLILNRIFNLFVSVIFWNRFNFFHKNIINQRLMRKSKKLQTFFFHCGEVIWTGFCQFLLKLLL